MLAIRISALFRFSISVQIAAPATIGWSSSTLSRTGKGISKEGQEKIFQEFKQDKQKGANDHGGTGLGLSISSKIVNLFGSELKVKSTLNKGSNFYFSIFVDRASKDDFSYEKASNLAVEWSNVNILLAEDNIVNQFLAKSLVESWGAKITVCSNVMFGGERFHKRLVGFDFDGLDPCDFVLVFFE